MRYLKTYEDNSYEDIESYIKDIFLSEVDDEKFDLSVSSRPVSHWQHQVSISLDEVFFEDNDFGGFRIGELKEFLLRLKSYLDSKNYKHTALTVLIHDGMDYDDSSKSTIDLTEKDIDEVDKWYNTIDAPGLIKVYLSINSSLELALKHFKSLKTYEDFDTIYFNKDLD